MIENDNYLLCPNCGQKYALSKNLYCGICGTALIERGAKRKYPDNLPGTQKEFRFLWELANIVVFGGIVEIVLGWVLPPLLLDWMPSLLKDTPLIPYFPSLVIFFALNIGGVRAIAKGESIKVNIRQNEHLQEVERLLRWLAHTAIKHE